MSHAGGNRRFLPKVGLPSLSFSSTADLRLVSPRSHIRPSTGVKGQGVNILGFMGVFGFFPHVLIYLFNNSLMMLKIIGQFKNMSLGQV